MTENINKYVYAMNAYGAALSDQALVEWSVLVEIPPARWANIINDELYGLKDVTMVSHWMEAIDHGEESETY